MYCFSFFFFVEYKYPGAKRIPAEYPLNIKPLAPVIFFQKPKSFSILGMIMANPMMLMMGLMALMAIGMPASKALYFYNSLFTFV